MGLNQQFCSQDNFLMDSSPISTTINLVHSMINTVCASIFIRSNVFYFYISLILTFIELKINFSSLIIHIIRLWDIFAGFLSDFSHMTFQNFSANFPYRCYKKYYHKMLCENFTEKY